MGRKTPTGERLAKNEAELYRLEQAKQMMRESGFIPVDPDNEDGHWIEPKE